MANGFASMREWPLAAWVVLAATTFFVVEYLILRLRQRRSQATADQAERRLVRLATALRRRNKEQADEGSAPDGEELALSGTGAIVHRPVPSVDLDDRLILVHDATPTHKVLEFPALRDGRGVVFCSGRLRVVSEEVWEKLLAADNALREKLNLEPLD